MRSQNGTAEQILDRLASRSHGVVTRRQLPEAGLSRTAIRQRLRRGSLVRVHAGVYGVGHRAPSVKADYIAAVLAAGDRAFLSGRAAAYLHGLLRGRPPPPEVIAQVKRHVPGVRTHRSRVLDSDHVTARHGIPVTTVPRTLVDLAAELRIDDLARACHEAGVRHGVTPGEVARVLARLPMRPGATKLQTILEGDVRLTLSKLEARFLARLREAGLVPPETNRPAGGRRVDCRWPDQRLTVELDGYRYHRSRHAWEQDRRREREARARGDDFRRYTYGDVFEQPRLMLTELRALLPGA